MITMDWFAWLSKTGLDHSLVYEYGLAFAHNELEEEDIRYFNHEFLQSMGISIAKHRLQIINLARKEKPVLVLLQHSHLWKLVSKTKKRLFKYIRTLVNSSSSTTSALVVMPAAAATGIRNKQHIVSNRWRGGTMFKRNQNNKLIKQDRQRMSTKQSSLLLTNGTTTTTTTTAAGYSTTSSTATSTPRVIPGGFPTTTSPRYCYDQYGDGYGDDDDDDDDGYWSGVDQHQQQVIIKWDAMFQDLKPT